MNKTLESKRKREIKAKYEKNQTICVFQTKSTGEETRDKSRQVQGLLYTAYELRCFCYIKSSSGQVNSYYIIKRWTGQQKNAIKIQCSRFQDSRHMKVVRLSTLRTDRLYPPRKYSWYSFLLEAESTPGSQCGQMDYVNEKFSMT